MEIFYSCLYSWAVGVSLSSWKFQVFTKDYAALSSLISVTVFNEAVSCMCCSTGKHFKFI